jgi:DNA-binding protein YbaB
MFDKLPPGVLPEDIIPELNEIAREYETKFMKQEFVGESGAGIVKATVIHPGKLTKVQIEEKYFNLENKRLVEDLIPSAIERALEQMSANWKEQLGEAQDRIQKIVNRFSEQQGSITNQEVNPPDREDEELN